MRAITEERHLARDPAYRAYQAFIAEHGLWAIVRRPFARRTLPAAAIPQPDAGNHATPAE